MTAPWQAQAACKGRWPLFWAEDDELRLAPRSQARDTTTGERVRRCLSYCARCPVIEECLTWAEQLTNEGRPLGLVAGGRYWGDPRGKGSQSWRIAICPECGGGIIPSGPQARPRYCEECGPVRARELTRLRNLRRDRKRVA